MKYTIRTKEKPIVLKTPLQSSEFTMHLEARDSKEVLVGKVVKPFCITT
jgi:hypothetical protein